MDRKRDSPDAMWFIFFSSSVSRVFSSGVGADWRSSDEALLVAAMAVRTATRGRGGAALRWRIEEGDVGTDGRGQCESNRGCVVEEYRRCKLEDQLKELRKEDADRDRER